MTLKRLKTDFAVCRLENPDDIDVSREFTFFSKTDEEISLVCDARFVPRSATAVEYGWKALKIEGTLDFGMVGVIADISRILAENGISVFVLSTYRTDYILIKGKHMDDAIRHLQAGGYAVIAG